MQSKWLGRVGLSALVLGCVGSSGGMVGCASERDPISRVQLNAIPKSFLVGDDYSNPADDPEFYARSMVVNVPYGESGSDFLMFTNTINSMSKIKWQIQESKLVGRVSFERITGTDGQGPTPKADPQRDPSKPLAQNEGIVVYQFNIESQFDIRRDYNPGTGEEGNVIVENSNDRPWVSRDYIRVDFSRNEVTTAYDFDTLSLLGVYNGIDYAPMQFDIRNPNDENAPAFDLDKGYFDVTNKLFANPKMINAWGMHFPGCLLPNIVGGGTQPVGNCNPNELTIRHSFKRVVDTDYEPQHWDGQKQETYGAFQTERQGYNRDGGIRDDLWKRHISRYNVWDRSHHYTNAEAMTGATVCKVDAECSSIGAVPGMSHCDTYNAKCTLPYADRKVRPIVWHYADKNAQDYYDVTREATEEWDTAMRVAVNTARYAECKRFSPDQDCAGKWPVTTGYFAEEEDAVFLVKEISACKRGDVKGRDPKTCDALAQELADQRGYSPTVVAIAKMSPVVIMCHGPVSDKDPVECGKPGTVARLGDLRYHLVTNVATPQTNSPWGIMSDSNDPLTGEHVAASINVWTHVNDLFARGIIDALRFINGELKTEDVTDGKYIDMYQEAAKQMKGGAMTPMMNAQEIDKRVAAVAGTSPELMALATKKISGKYGGASQKELRLKDALVKNLKKVAQTHAGLDAPSVNAPLYQARIDLAKNSPAQAQVATIAMQQLGQSSFGQVALDANTKVQATSILAGLNPTAIRGLQQKREMSLAARGACIMPFEATAPLGYVGLGDIVQQKFGKFNPQDPPAVQAERAAKMKTWLARRAHFSVMSHEMGHSFALRHNFVSSSDAWSFRPQYWQLRTNDKKASQDCKEDGTSDGKECVGARWLDPVTANESKNLISMWSQSSTMEYAGEPTQDLLGLGSYDFGAARMFYGDVTTVYDDSKFKNTAPAGVVAEAHQNEFGGLLGYRYGDFSAPIHYSRLDAEFGLIKNCKTVDAGSYKPVNWDTTINGEWNDVVDGHIVTNESGQHTRCKQPEVDFVQWDALKNTEEKTHAHDAAGRVRVPQGFASDEWADLGNVEVFRHDNGADLFERMHFWIAQQEINHIFSNYRRGRRDFSVWGAFNRTLGRYHEKMRDTAKAIGLYTTLARDTVTLYNDGKDPEGFVAAILKQIAVDNTVASSIAFDHFAHVFSRPQPGEHATVGTGDPTLRSLDENGNAGGFSQNVGRVALSVANGVTGGFGTISLGGRPIENALSQSEGRDYNRDYTLNVGSYYEKAFTAYLLTESADNFISASRDDFVDPRFRSVSLADVFPDGFRRWLGNNLTNDESIKGVYVRGTGGAGPGPADLDPNGYALLGQTSWWPQAGIETCFPSGEKLTCRDPFATTPIGGAGGVGPVVDPQIGWEQQRFALFFSLIYLPENGRTNWTDQIRIYDVAEDGDPGFDNRIEFHNPDGKSYVAQTYGTEVLFGKTVQKGIGARVLEYANELNAKAVVTAPVLRGTVQVGIKPVLNATGQVQYLESGQPSKSCDNSRDCLKMRNYTNMPKLVHDASGWFGRTRFGGPKGVY